MANFSDFEKEYQQVREDFQEQLNLDWNNVKLHIEQLRMISKYFKQYDYLFVLKDLELAEKYLDEAVSMLAGFETIPEDTIPEDEKFEPDPELDQEPEEIPGEPKQATIFDDSKNGVAKFKAFYELLHKGK